MNISHIFVFSFVAAVLSLLRLLLTDESSYVWLNWNLFLALIPLGIAWMVKKTSWNGLAYLLAGVWLVFLPNAPYLLTDFIHLNNVGPTHILWYDGIMIFTYSLAGVGSWVVGTRMIAQRLFLTLPFVALIALVTGFGVYVGRYIRFNSWDLAESPQQVFQTLFDIIIHPTQHEPVILMTCVFASLLFVSYIVFAPFGSSPRLRSK